MKFGLFLLVGGFASLLVAEHIPDGVTTPVDTSLSTFKVEQIGKVKGEDVVQDNFGYFEDYFVPNEHFNHLYEACLPKEGGAYITVGTFRGMNIASSGKVSHLVLMDINRTIAVFNRANIQLINKASDRFEYLSLLISGTTNPELENKARRGDINLNDFLVQLPKSKTLVSDWKALGVVLSDDETKQLEPRLSKWTSTDFQLEFQNFNRVGAEGMTYFGNDGRFSKIKELISQNKVTVLAGDVKGNETLKNLGDAFRRQDTQVSAVDVSNIPDYLDSEGEKTMLSNIRSLPFRENGVFILTGNNRRGPALDFVRKSGDSWQYQAVPRTYLEGMSKLPYGGQIITTTDGKTRKMVPDPGNPPDATVFYTPEDAPCVPKPN